MILKLGTLGKVRFLRGIKKTNIFECGDNGVVVERENNIIYMYVTNAACSKIHCKLTLGTNAELKKAKFVCIAYNEHVMLLNGVGPLPNGEIMIIVDYDAQQVAVNQDNILVTPKGWTEDVQAPWDSDYNGMFGVYGDLIGEVK